MNSNNSISFEILLSKAQNDVHANTFTSVAKEIMSMNVEQLLTLLGKNQENLLLVLRTTALGIAGNSLNMTKEANQDFIPPMGKTVHIPKDNDVQSWADQCEDKGSNNSNSNETSPVAKETVVESPVLHVNGSSRPVMITSATLSNPNQQIVPTKPRIINQSVWKKPPVIPAEQSTKAAIQRFDEIGNGNQKETKHDSEPFTVVGQNGQPMPRVFNPYKIHNNGDLTLVKICSGRYNDTGKPVFSAEFMEKMGFPKMKEKIERISINSIFNLFPEEFDSDTVMTPAEILAYLQSPRDSTHWSWFSYSFDDYLYFSPNPIKVIGENVTYGTDTAQMKIIDKRYPPLIKLSKTGFEIYYLAKTRKEAKSYSDDMYKGALLLLLSPTIYQKMAQENSAEFANQIADHLNLASDHNDRTRLLRLAFSGCSFGINPIQTKNTIARRGGVTKVTKSDISIRHVEYSHEPATQNNQHDTVETP